VIRDITERKRVEKVLLKNSKELYSAYEKLTASEEELRERVDDLTRSGRALQESEERYRTILDQAADTVFIHDQNGRILEVNQKACQNLGYTREELLLLSIGDIDRDAIKTGMHESWSAILAGETHTFESNQIRKDGSTFPVEISLGSVRLHQGPVVLSIIRDITVRKRAEETIRVALAEKEILLREVHHRVKNNLAGIIALINLQISSLSDPAFISPI
jgi:PAS domain S-box-containing protein